MQPTPVSPSILTTDHLQAWIARRERTRRRVKRLIATVLGIVVVCLALVWTFFHDQLTTMGKLGSIGLTVDWDLNLANLRTGGVTYVSFTPRWMTNNVKVDSVALATITRLRHVKTLEISSLYCTEDDLAFVADLPDLVELHIDRTAARGLREFPPPAFSDRVLDYVAGLTHLKTLTLTNNRITDEGLAKLANLTELESLDIDNTRVTDRGLMALKGLKNLKILRVQDTKVTREGVAAFQRIMPNVEVTREPETFNPNQL